MQHQLNRLRGEYRNTRRWLTMCNELKLNGLKSITFKIMNRCRAKLHNEIRRVYRELYGREYKR